MSPVTTLSVVRQVGSLFDGGTVAGLTDRELIERFLARSDGAGEAAFAALVSRHGPMVLDICQQILGNLHDAEDAFQAVFLVLAHKARSIRDPDLLANWLYGVAVRTARKARARLARRRTNEEAATMRRLASDSSVLVEPEVPPAEHDILAREQTEALYSEISRLHGSFRLPVLLCYFEGLTLDEAASRLKCPVGTVRSRLARAREKLRRGLTRRGVTLSATAIASALAARSTSACVSCALCETTARAAMTFLAGQTAAGAISASAVAVANGALRSMLVTKLKLVALALLLLGPVAAGAGLVAQAKARQAGKPDLRSSDAKADDASLQPDPERMFVVGRVLDPRGTAVPSAAIMIYAANKVLSHDPYDGLSLLALGQASSDISGRFRIDATRTASSRHYRAGAVALASGFGAGWVDLDPDAERPSADLVLRHEQVINGRLVDLSGQPVRDVTVFVQRMGFPTQGRRGYNVVESTEGPYFWSLRDHLPAWPRPAKTDADGRYTVRGVGRDVRVSLGTDDPRFARSRFTIDTGAAMPKSVTTALEPAKMISGRITDADTGKPIPRARLRISSITEGGHRATFNEFEADAEGRYRANPLSSDRYFVAAFAPEGQPYITINRVVDWTKGSIEHQLDLPLRRGAVIHGTVIDRNSGMPIAEAKLSFTPRRGAVDATYAGYSSPGAVTAADGSYQLAVPPRPGTLVVLAPSEDFVLREIGDRIIYEDKPGGRREYAHAFAPYEPKPDRRNLEINFTLRRGVKLEGRAIGPDGRPVPSAAMISRLFLPPGRRGMSNWQLSENNRVKDGHFEVPGLDPEVEVPVYFVEPKLKLGATGRFSGKSAAGRPVTVRLEPCGSSRARLVSRDGKPQMYSGRSRLIRIYLVVTPGAPRGPELMASLQADEGNLGQIDPANYEHPPASDAEGRILFPALIPGATYRLYEFTGTTRPLRKEFTVKAGETLDLGDILIEKPQAL